MVNITQPLVIFSSEPYVSEMLANNQFSIAYKQLQFMPSI